MSARSLGALNKQLIAQLQIGASETRALNAVIANTLMKQIYLVLDLKDDPSLIAQYEQWHRAENIWPEVIDSLSATGIVDLEIFRTGNRLVMRMDVPDTFVAGEQATVGALNERTLAWEEFMWTFQQSLPFAQKGEKWVQMHCIFSLRDALATAHRRKV